MAIAWPAGISQAPLRQGYSFTAGVGVTRSKMDAGPDFQRRFTARPGDQHRCTFKMTASQWNTFFAWWRDTLAEGALSFDWTEPYSGAAVTARFVGTTPPSAAPHARGPFVAVTALLEVI